MRLINTLRLTIKEFIGDAVPPYVILSHTWGSEEMTLQEMTSGLSSPKSGMNKIVCFCEQARRDGFDWAWCDTCCIDKQSSAELSEAINSMFRWYQKAQICYVYLEDVQSTLEGFGFESRPRWFTRGWTLQELLAPQDVEFFDQNWVELGTKRSMAGILSDLTRIPRDVLLLADELGLSTYSAAEKFSWAACRQTTRIEDRSYSLLGLLNVNMPLLYGEGGKAFHRLQKKVIKATSDPTVFAWSRPYGHRGDHPEPQINLCGLLAESPDDFRWLKAVKAIRHLEIPPIVRDGSVTINLPCRDLGFGQTAARLGCKSEIGEVCIHLKEFSREGCWLRREQVNVIPAGALNVPESYQDRKLEVLQDNMELIERVEGQMLRAPKPLVSIPTLSLFLSSDSRAGTIAARLRYMTHQKQLDAPLKYTIFSSNNLYSQDAENMFSTATPRLWPRNDQPFAVLEPYVSVMGLYSKQSRTICVVALLKGREILAELLIGMSASQNGPRLYITEVPGPLPRSATELWKFHPTATDIDRPEMSLLFEGMLYHVSARARKYGKGVAASDASETHYHIHIKVAGDLQNANARNEDTMTDV